MFKFKTAEHAIRINLKLSSGDLKINVPTSNSSKTCIGKNLNCIQKYVSKF
jgi:hypothetical protein